MIRATTRPARPRARIVSRPGLLPGIRGLSIWRDRIAVVALALAAVANLAVYVYIWRQLDRLPAMLPLHYNGAGEVDLIGPPGDLFRMPLIGTVILLTNLLIAARLHGTEPVGARLLVIAGALVAQILMYNAAVGIVARAFG